MKAPSSEALRWLAQAQNELAFARLAQRESFPAQCRFIAQQVSLGAEILAWAEDKLQPDRWLTFRLRPAAWCMAARHPPPVLPRAQQPDPSATWTTPPRFRP